MRAFFFRFDRALLGDLARLAWETVREVYRAALGWDPADAGLPGMVAGIQTFGELIHWHPHISLKAGSESTRGQCAKCASPWV